MTSQLNITSPGELGSGFLGLALGTQAEELQRVIENTKAVGVVELGL